MVAVIHSKPEVAVTVVVAATVELEAEVAVKLAAAIWAATPQQVSCSV
jgi:hypothetical protein